MPQLATEHLHLLYVTLLAQHTRCSNSAREWRYYTVAVVEPGADLSIALTPLSGDQDPDLYVSAPHLPLPTLANHTWASVRFGADALLLQVRVTTMFENVIEVVFVGCASLYAALYHVGKTCYCLVITCIDHSL
jgi:hypothetical protein